VWAALLTFELFKTSVSASQTVFGKIPLKSLAKCRAFCETCQLTELLNKSIVLQANRIVQSAEPGEFRFHFGRDSLRFQKALIRIAGGLTFFKKQV
jgi:hypothetical protein